MPNANIRRYLRHGTLCQISTFEASARLGSLTRAARELSMAQPTASMHIKKLSEIIGAPLFEQVGKRIFLTESGRRLYATCDDMFRVLSDLESSLAEVRGLRSGQLRLAVSTAGKTVAARLLAAYARRYPNIDASLQIQNRRALQERLAGNEDDLTIFANPPEGAEFVRLPFLRNPMIALTRANHPLVREKRIPLARLAEEPFVMREPGSGTRAIVESLFAGQGLAIRPRMELGTNEAIAEAIIGGLGVSIMSRCAVEGDIERGRLAILDVEGLPLEGRWTFVYPAGKQLSTAAASFLEFCRRNANAIVMRRDACRDDPCADEFELDAGLSAIRTRCRRCVAREAPSLTAQARRAGTP